MLCDESVREMRAMSARRNDLDMSPRRPPAHGVLYEITEALVDGLTKLQKSGRTQEEIARELGAHIGKKVHPSTISNIVNRKHPSSHLAYALCELYGWPIPPVARIEAAVSSEFVAQLEELAQESPDKYRDVQDLVQGLVQEVRGRKQVARVLGRNLLKRETPVRGLAPNSDSDDE